MKILAFLVSGVLLTGCAGYSHSIKERELARYEDKVYVPVGALMQIQSYFDTTAYHPLDHIYSIMLESERFRSVSLGEAKLPYVLDIKFSTVDTSTAGEKVGGMVSAATLFIVPHKDTRTYKISLGIYENGQLKYSNSYYNTMKGAVSLSNPPLKGIKESVRLMTIEMLHDMEMQSILPLMTKSNNSIQPNAEASVD